MSDLFRKEVIDKQGQRLFGDVILAAPISHKAVTALLAVIIAGLIALVSLGEYSHIQSGHGHVIMQKDNANAQIWVPSHAAGSVKIGQAVTLTYDAFPAPKFGTQRGTVSAVSPKIEDPKEGPRFPVTVTLDNHAINVDGRDYPIQTDMKVSGDIMLGQEKIWQWFFRPRAKAAP